MREFFKGWRRKVGCGLLLVAFGFTVSWMDEFVRDNVWDGDGGDPRKYEMYWKFTLPPTLLAAVLLLWPQKKE